MSEEKQNLFVFLTEEIDIGHTAESLSAAFEATSDLKTFKEIVDRHDAKILNSRECQSALREVFQEAVESPKVGFLSKLLLKGIQKFQSKLLERDDFDSAEIATNTLAISVPLETVSQIKQELKALDIVEKVGKPSFVPQ